MSLKQSLIEIKNNQSGFINLCIPIGYGFLYLVTLWPAMILDMAFNTSLSMSDGFLYSLGIAVDIVIIYFIGSFFDNKKKVKLHKYFYRIISMSGFLIASGILYALAYTMIGC